MYSISVYIKPLGTHTDAFPIGTGILSAELKQPGCDANYSAYRTEVKNDRNHASTSLYVLMARYLIKHRDNLRPKPYE
jgi:hypothetical protein